MSSTLRRNRTRTCGSLPGDESDRPPLVDPHCEMCDTPARRVVCRSFTLRVQPVGTTSGASSMSVSPACAARRPVADVGQKHRLGDPDDDPNKRRQRRRCHHHLDQTCDRNTPTKPPRPTRHHVLARGPVRAGGCLQNITGHTTASQSPRQERRPSAPAARAEEAGPAGIALPPPGTSARRSSPTLAALSKSGIGSPSTTDIAMHVVATQELFTQTCRANEERGRVLAVIGLDVMAPR